MSVRTTIAVLAVGLASLVVWLALPTDALRADGTDSVSVLPAFAPEDIVAIGIAQQGREIVLGRTDDGWGVTVWDGYPADGARAERLLVELSSLRVIERRTDDPAFRERLGLDDAGTRFRLVSREGEIVVDVIAGRFIEARGMVGRMVRRSDDDTAYWVEQPLSAPVSARAWTQDQVIDISPGRIAQVRITHPDGEVVQLSALEGDTPGVTPMTVDAPSPARRDVPALVRMPAALQRLPFLGVRPSSTPAPPETMEVITEFETSDGLVISVRTRPLSPEMATARFEVYPLDETAADEAALLNEQLSGWDFLIGAERAVTMRLHPADLALISLRDAVSPGGGRP